MRFMLTLTMPTLNGNSVHRMVCDHPAKSFDDFVDIIASDEFVIVDEIHRDTQSGQQWSSGLSAINTSYIGKVRVV